jgi:alpha 1,3-glucosidase
VAVDGVVVQRINSRNLLNFERYREVAARHSTLRPPDANANDATVTIDAAAHPGVDTNSLWEEDFGGHTDKKPRGPASVGMDVSFEGEVPSLFGLPEHATNARLPFYEEPYRFFNLDVFEYEINEPMALYGAIPILWGVHRASGRNVASGFLWINPSETFVKLERNQGAEAGTGPAHAWWTSESGVIDVAVLVGPTPTQVSAQFHALTGPAPIPPLWALGKHQCRWNYMSEKDVATVDGSYDKHDLPYDVIWLDIEHTEGKKYFTWNEANFPTPDKMIQKISDKRRKFVNVVDPHIKKDTDFHVWKEISEAGLFVKKVDWKNKDDPTDTKPEVWVEIKEIPDPNATVPDIWNEEEDGIYEPPKIANPEYKGDWKARQILDYDSPKSDFEGWCWPGTSMYPDFTNPKMREYWGAQFALDKYKGTNADTYIWNDMNEPSVFNGPEVTMPRDAIHGYGNVEHRDVHNMYGYYVHRGTFEGLEKRTPGDRPFVLTRSFFIGSHKYSAIWTGDNYAKWEHLKASIAMVGALTLGGQSLVGADVGGFFKHPDSEMMVRWYQLGVLAYPFFRNHAHLETPRREPFTLDETNMNRLKATLQMRYQMLPYWYTLFEEYHRLGSPVVRPLFWDFVDDLATHDDETATESEIMLGDSVLVYGVTAPITDSYKEASVYLPKAAGWFDLHDGTFFASGRHTVPLSIERIPAYYRAGSIIPLKKRVRRSSSCMAFDPLTLMVHLDPTTGKAHGRLYVDDYKTKDYLQGKSLKVEFEFASGVLKASKVTGQLPETITAEVERVQIFGLTKAPVGATLEVDGKSVELAAPVVTATGTYTTATLKIAPWIDLRKGNWALKVI